MLNIVTGLISIMFSAFKLLVELSFASEHRKSRGSFAGFKVTKELKLFDL
jgi:hypothetical protein